MSLLPFAVEFTPTAPSMAETTIAGIQARDAEAALNLAYARYGGEMNLLRPVAIWRSDALFSTIHWYHWNAAKGCFAEGER